jgi:hypothetical protein
MRDLFAQIDAVHDKLAVVGPFTDSRNIFEYNIKQ